VKLALMLGSFSAGLVLMVGFEHVVTRILGVLALFCFLVTGVFLIADPEFLGNEEEAMHDERSP
jgi:hypothetical protein